MCICTTFVLFVLVKQSQADDLDKFEGQFKKKKENPPESQSSSDLSDPEKLNPKVCKDLTGCLISDIFANILSAIIPNPLDATFKGEKLYFSSYPYETDIDNYVKTTSHFGDDFAFTITSAFQQINPTTDGKFFNFDFRSYYRFGISSDYLHYRESSALQSNQLDFYSFYFFIAPSESKYLIFDTGLGVIALSGHDHYVGPSLKLNWTLFPKKPFLIKSHVSLGGLNWIPLWDLGAELGVMVGPAEIYFGYRSLAGPIADLSGPLVGLRWWF
jgi:hypothetical protein